MLHVFFQGAPSAGQPPCSPGSRWRQQGSSANLLDGTKKSILSPKGANSA